MPLEARRLGLDLSVDQALSRRYPCKRALGHTVFFSHLESKAFGPERGVPKTHLSVYHGRVCLVY